MNLEHCKQSGTRLLSKVSTIPGFNGVETGALVRNQMGIIVYFKFPPPKYAVPKEWEGYPVEVVDESKTI